MIPLDHTLISSQRPARSYPHAHPVEMHTAEERNLPGRSHFSADAFPPMSTPHLHSPRQSAPADVIFIALGHSVWPGHR
jgi:hypothetical protein